MQAFLFQIIGHLEFAPSAGSEKVVRSKFISSLNSLAPFTHKIPFAVGGAILTPIVPDEFSKGAQMPLTMKYAKFE
jgi:hypothetical protein